MTKEEAIRRLEQGEPFSEVVDKSWEEAVSIAILALKKMEQINSIINFPFNVQEDIFKYKAICEAMKDFC